MDKFIVSKKRPAVETPTAGDQESKSSKLNDTYKIITINSNSLANRINDKRNHADFVDFMRRHMPDVVAVQEVRLPAKAFSSNPKKNDGSRRDRTKIDDRDSKVATEKRVLHNCDAFGGYRMYFSLSDWRYAGTMVAVRKGSEEPSWIEYTFGAAEKQSIKHQKQNSEKTPSVQSSDVIVESVVAGDSSVHGIMQEKSSSVSSSEPSCSASPTSDASIYESSNVIDGHYSDGRVVCIGLPSFDLLATYAPNNGSTEASFLRRRLWDKDIQLFLSRAAERERHVVWVGDLNVAHTPADVTHPLFFSQQMRQSEKGDSGQAGYTPNERRRFSEILSTCSLIDTYRHFHPVSTCALEEELQSHTFSDDDPGLNPLGPNYTWRGAAGTQNAEWGKYYGKGMRIDYALVPQNMMDRVISCEILGEGKDLEGFLGSDHCPVMLTLKNP